MTNIIEAHNIQIGESVSEISPIERVANDFQILGYSVLGVPEGGTFGMIQDVNGAWVSQLTGAFDQQAYQDFNDRVREYDARIDLLAHPQPAQVHLQSGHYRTEEIASFDFSVDTYTDLLYKELALGDYPRGVRLDSSILVDEQSYSVFSAVACGILFRDIFQKAKGIAGIEVSTAVDTGKTNELYPDEKQRVLDVFPKMTVLISMGSDQKRIKQSFLDAIAYYTGITFVVLSANSSYGVQGGDAEINLSDMRKVVEAINEGILPRGTAYDVGDGLVSTSVLEKMNPEAETIQLPVKGRDEKYYGATFFARHSLLVSEIGKSPWFFHNTKALIPELLFYLAFRPSPFDQEFFDENPTAFNASSLSKCLTSVQIKSIDDIPEEFPVNTRVIVITAPGRANGPGYPLIRLNRAIAKLNQVTEGCWKPVIIVTSECVEPYTTEDYGAAVITQLKKNGRFEGFGS